MFDDASESRANDDAALTPHGELRQLIFHLARNVTAARAAAGLTQRQLADAAELSRATVHLIEAGAGDPRVSTIAHLAKALQLSPVQLLDPARRPKRPDLQS